MPSSMGAVDIIKQGYRLRCSDRIATLKLDGRNTSSAGWLEVIVAKRAVERSKIDTLY